MLVNDQVVLERPVLFCLHYLGGSSREWAHVAALLGGTVRCVPIDLPGFGTAAQTLGYTVAEMADHVAEAVRLEAPLRWMIAGHSMGAKVATVLARSAENGAVGLTGLEGVVLLAGSPPGPEPMDERQRATMMSWFADGPEASVAQARTYITDNSDKLDDVVARQGVDDALRANRAAWEAWLEHGSREDWSQRIGVLQTPTLIIAGEQDVNLGADAQRSLTAPHFENVRLVTLAGAKHLLPMERPQDVARLIDDHVRHSTQERERRWTLAADYDALMHSDRVSRWTRAALLARAQPDDPAYEPAAMSVDALTALRAVVQCVIPQTGPTRIDLAARIDAQLASNVGDGWRFADLPLDAAAYRAGILTLDDEAHGRYGQEFAVLDGDRQIAVLQSVAEGRLTQTTGDEIRTDRLNAKQMQHWFEDLRSDAVRLFVAHPQTLARMGYSGIANGGDGEPKTGFVQVGIGQREAWEPQSASDVTP